MIIILGAVSHAKVGLVRDHLDHRVKEYMVAHYCQQHHTEEDYGGPLFEPNSLVGLPMKGIEGHWMSDETTATWTRIIVAPRREFYYPIE